MINYNLKLYLLIFFGGKGESTLLVVTGNGEKGKGLFW